MATPSEVLKVEEPSLGAEANSAVISVGEEMKIIVHKNNVQEDCVVFVVQDTTDTNWQKSRYTCSLPLSTAVTDLYSAVAKETGYKEGSFLLAWYDKESNDADCATPLSPKSTQTLYELDMPCEPKRCYLYLRDGPDRPPIKETSEGGGQSQSVELASSVTTSPSSHTFNNNWSSTHYTNKSDTGYVGLVNQAMTCYLNSLLQTLYMTPEFRKALYSWQFNGDIGEGIKSIPYQLQRLFIHLQTSTKRAVETTGVTKSFGWDSSEAWQQHDVQELCRVMFDALEKRFRKDGHKQPELINELYQGDMKDYVKCSECNNESAREDHFLDIPLVIKPFGSTKAYGSVEEALDGFVDPETLSGDNQYHCDKCRKKCNAHKGLKFTRFPYLLTLQLKRFDFDYSTMHRIKLNDRMTFPSVLNLNKFVEPSSMSKKKDSEEVDFLYKDFIIEKYENRSSYIMRNSADSVSISDEWQPVGACGSKLIEMLKEGPYVYELFSIMIHSGSAIGGHYYAYIKSFSDKQWYSFNDQSVIRISREDIEQTFGGSERSRGYYSSVYASSANAYMLMYRRVDKEANESFSEVRSLPQHVCQQIKEEQQHELREKERQEWERNLCKFRVFMRHPTTGDMVERKIEVHKDKSLRDATVEAYKSLGLTRLVPLKRCRLVKFDEYAETLDQSFNDAQQDLSFGYHVGGARSYYSFELFMEIRSEEEKFKIYNKGGLNLKVLIIDLPKEAVREPVQFRAEQGWTVGELKIAIALHFDLDSSVMNIALETYQNEGKQLTSVGQTLKSEGFYRKHTVFVCCDAVDLKREFQVSAMNRVIDKYANAINLFITVPPPPANPKLHQDGTPVTNQPQVNGPRETFEDDFVDGGDSSDKKNTNGEGKGNNGEGNSAGGDGGDASAGGDGGDASAGGDGGDASAGGDGGSVSVGGDGSAGGTLSWDIGGGGSTWGDGGDGLAEGGNIGDIVVIDDGISRGDGGDLKSSLEGETEDVTRPLQRTITIQIDRRKTLGDLKKKLESIVLLPATEFKIYRVYSNNQEYEVFRLQDSLQSVPNETKMIVRLGRALLPGEFRIKLSLLRINEVEYFKSIMDSIVAKGMTVRELKERLVKEGYEQGIEFSLHVDRIRLRKKTWRSPGTVYLDKQIFEKDIHVFANYEMFIEPLEGEDPMKHATQMQVYVRHWHPSTHTVDNTQEIILDDNTPEHLKQKLAEFSGIPTNRVQFAKAFGSFPSEMSLLDLEGDLEWNPDVSTINSSPLAIYDDGAILYFKDSEEDIAELSTERKAEIQKQENARLSKYNTSGGTHSRYPHRPEKALKIWTEDDDVKNSTQTTSENNI